MTAPFLIRPGDLADRRAPLAEHRHRAPAPAARDLRSEEAPRGAFRANEGDQGISGLGSEAARGIAGVRFIHQLSQEFATSARGRGSEQLRESANAEVFMD